MAGRGGKLGWKIVGIGSAVLAGIAARKALTTTWKLAVGDNPPVNPEAPDTSMKQAVAWAVASGAAVGLARMLMTRKAANYWRRSTGSLPPGMETVTP